MNVFDKLSEKYSKNIAVLTDDNETVSYKSLEELSNKFGKKIKKRSLIFNFNTNSLGSLVGYYSCLRNNVVPLMLDANIDDELLIKLLDIYKPEYLWLPSNMLNKFTNSDILYIFNNYNLIKRNKWEKYNFKKELALLLTTSGSTGSPKLVKLSYKNIESNAFSIIKYLSITEKEKPITVLPMYYSFGLSIINSHLYSGATILLTNRSLFEKEFWTFLKEEKATSLSGVPYTYEILKKLRFFRLDLPHLKTLTQAGGKLNNALIKEFAEYCNKNNKQFYVMYGQTEATARMSYLSPEFTISKLGSMGVAIPDGEFFLIDEEGKNIKEINKEGELVYKGPNVSMGYAECKEDLNKGDENKGILYTGDLAKRDEDGFYYITGRKKRFIKLFGNRVNLDETEQILKTKIQNSACVGKDDKMIIYITENNKTEEIKEYISKKTGINRNAFDVKYISKIPKNAAGKTIYSLLKIDNEY